MLQSVCEGRRETASVTQGKVRRCLLSLPWSHCRAGLSSGLARSVLDGSLRPELSQLMGGCRRLRSQPALVTLLSCLLPQRDVSGWDSCPSGRPLLSSAGFPLCVALEWIWGFLILLSVRTSSLGCSRKLASQVPVPT